MAMADSATRHETTREHETSLAVAYERLAQIDWTFAEADTRGATHSIHPYPAKFIPQIPRTLIDVLHPGDRSAVLDPFCGSGTTLVEAALAGVHSVGVDLHPLACLISKVKVTRIESSLSYAASRVVDEARNANNVEPPDIPALDHWFTPDVQLALAALTRSIAEIENEVIRDALRVALSSIIVRVSNQDSDTRYAAVEKDVSSNDVFDGFLAAARKTEGVLHETWGGMFSPPETLVLNRNILEVEPDDIPSPVSLVVTSPPYPNAYEYWLYHKYRMYWLGMDPIKVRAQEIGARPHYFKKDPQTPEDFARQMERVWSLLGRVIEKDGHACFQVGSSVIHGEHVDNAEIISRTSKPHGFKLMARFQREIPQTKKAFNAHHARIRDEQILILRKCGP